MNPYFEIELDGRRVRVDQATGEVRQLGPDGRTVSSERIQVAAGSVQGLFSALEESANLANPAKNA